MKKIYFALSLAFISASCSTIFVNSNEVEPGIYQIQAHGNVFNTREAMLEKALKKAEKKCGHSNFKRIGNEILGNTKVYNTSISGYTNSPNITIRVDCNPEH